MSTRSDKTADVARKQVKERGGSRGGGGGGGGDNAGLREALVVVVNGRCKTKATLQARSSESRVVPQETAAARLTGRS